jgi:hypothetical protein
MGLGHVLRKKWGRRGVRERRGPVELFIRAKGAFTFGVRHPFQIPPGRSGSPHSQHILAVDAFIQAHLVLRVVRR